ncbi:C-terminal binding protein [Geodermatophilaceae bacterium NBWT11]|nr:C-terminal binding protein [Geodermatophilaceae bacterium NBWT11]
MDDVRTTVLVTEVAWPTTDAERAVLAAAGADLVLAPSDDPAELVRLAADADAILTCFATVSAQVLDAAPRCRTVARYGVGVDNIDVAHATALGMVVSNVPVYCVDEVADSALLGILALARRLLPLTRDVAAGRWGSDVPGSGTRLRGKVLGLVGLGTIGSALAERARVLGLDVIAYDLSGRPAPGVRVVDTLDALLAEADAVSLHVPLTAGTHHLIGPAQLAAMKPTSWLVNTARGGLVDTEALLAALDAGEIAGAALDVTDPEPLPADHPLRTRDDVVLTPHTAFSSDGSLVELATRAATNVVDVLQGRVPATVVNRDVLTSPALRAPLEPR